MTIRDAAETVMQPSPPLVVVPPTISGGSEPEHPSRECPMGVRQERQRGFRLLDCAMIDGWQSGQRHSGRCRSPLSV
jgi:hypothetical protein